jgi:hypothetical protein
MPCKPKQCRHCSSPAGPRVKLYCDYHAGYNAGYSVAFMRYHRAGDPDYRDKEREAVKVRMRKLRASPGYVRPENRA